MAQKSSDIQLLNLAILYIRIILFQLIVLRVNLIYFQRLHMNVKQENFNLLLQVNYFSASLMLDLCAREVNASSWAASRCLSKSAFKLTSTVSSKDRKSRSPLQVGGFARTFQFRDVHGWTYSPITKSFRGCITQLKIGNEVCI